MGELKKKVKTSKKTKRIRKVKEEVEYKPRFSLYLTFAVVIILLVMIAHTFDNKNVEDTLLASITYVPSGDVSYKVTYIDNPILDEKVIDKNKTYISQYTDKVNASFDYRINYTDKVSGSYSYYVKAKLIAYTPGDETDDLWTKEYVLSDVETVDFNDDFDYYIDKDIDIDFQKYVDDYNLFKISSTVSSNAKLVVELIVNNSSEYSGVDDIQFESSLLLSIPIGEPTYKIDAISKIGKSKTISNIEKNDTERLFIKIISYLCFGLAAVVLAILILIIKNDKKVESEFRRKIKKIISTYDSILVNVEQLPVLTDYSVVNVTSFEELVDAQNEVRLPINYKEDKKRRTVKFVLVRDNLAWVYTLKESDSSDEK